MNRPRTPAHDPLARRVQALEAAFAEIAATRMAGMPIVHPRLAVQAVGFEPEGEPEAGGCALGVLVTPWFMNLVRLPLSDAAALALPAPGLGAPHRVGGWRFDFFGGDEDGLGRYASASLFSPMAEFADQAAAVATARAVLAQLRASALPSARGAGTPAAAPHAGAGAAPGPGAAAPQGPAFSTVPGPARRGFLFGRSAPGGGAR